MLFAAAENLAQNGRVIVCGRMAFYDDPNSAKRGDPIENQLLVTRASMTGFLVFDYWHRRGEALGRILEWHNAGLLKTREDVIFGFENMPAALLRVLDGSNFGKQLVKVYD